MPPARRLLAEAWLSLASRLRARGDVKLALGACRQALSLAPSYADGHRQLALNFQALQRYQEAIRSLRRLLALKPRDQAAGHLLNALQGRSVDRAPRGYVENLFDRFAADFDQRMQGVLNYRVPAVLGKRLRRVVKPRRRFERALDLGCGTGLMGEVMRPLSRHVTGVDLSGRMLRKARRKRLYNNLECDDVIRFLSRCRMRYDLVAAADVFIYLGDLAPAFRSVANRLTDAGVFALSIERASTGPYRLRKSGRFAHTPDYIRRLAADNRFDILTHDRIGLRLEHGCWVNGDAFLLVRSSRGEMARPGASSLWRRFMPQRCKGKGG